MASALRRCGGHLRTIHRLLADLARPPVAPPAERWRGRLEDPVTGAIEVSGCLSRTGEATAAVVLVHGLGGSAESAYMARAARVAWSLGVDTLRLDLRGADGVGGDFYHAGLTAELHAAAASRALVGYERLAVLGYSMGGHVALRYAAEVTEPRVGAVAAICPPLDLRTVSLEFDQPSRRLYRYWVLRQLRQSFRRLSRNGADLPSRYAAIRRARTFHGWDRLTVVPRFGFSSVEDYYARASAARVVHRLRIPCLVLASEADPMVTPRALEPFLPPHAWVGRYPDDLAGASRGRSRGDRPAAFTVLWHPRAGHVAFPGEVAPESRVLSWLASGPLRDASRALTVE